MLWNMKYIFMVLLISLCLLSRSVVAENTIDTSTSKSLTTEAEKSDEILRLKELVERLKSKDSEDINSASKELCDFGDKAAPVIPDLIKIFLDDDGNVQFKSGQILKRLGSISVEPLMNELHKQKNKQNICRIIWLLGKISDHRAVEIILPFLKDNDPKVRKSVAMALWGMPDARALDVLVKALDDNNDEVRYSIVGAIALIRDTRTAERLLELFSKDSSIDVKERAAFGLGYLRYHPATKELINNIPDPSDVKFLNLSARISYALGEIGDPIAREPLVRVLLNKKADFKARIYAAHALGKLIPDAHTIDALVEVWKDSNSDLGVREAAAMALGYTRNPKANAALKFAVEQHIDKITTTKAIELLGENGDIERYQILKEFSKTTKSEVNRLYAEYMLKTRYRLEEGLVPEE